MLLYDSPGSSETERKSFVAKFKTIRISGVTCGEVGNDDEDFIFALLDCGRTDEDKDEDEDEEGVVV